MCMPAIQCTWIHCYIVYNQRTCLQFGDCDVHTHVHMQCLSQSNATLQGDISKHLVLATWLFFSPLVIEAFSLFCKQQQQQKGICKEQAKGLAAGQLFFSSDIKALKDHLRKAGLLHDHHDRDLVQVGTCMGLTNFAKHTTLSNVLHIALSQIVRIINMYIYHVKVTSALILGLSPCMLLIWLRNIWLC